MRQGHGKTSAFVDEQIAWMIALLLDAVHGNGKDLLHQSGREEIRCRIHATFVMVRVAPIFCAMQQIQQLRIRN